jgi:hypothetical protein
MAAGKHKPMTLTGCNTTWCRNRARTRWVLWVVACLACPPCATLAVARPAAAEFSGLVSLADGEPFTLLRGDSAHTGTAGVTLVSGDILETRPGTFLVIEVRGGSLLAVGPDSEVYFLPRAEITTLVVLKGWVKADVRATSKASALRILATRLGIQVQKAVVLLRADARSDAIFAEEGSGTLLLRDDAATHIDKEIQANQFLVREHEQTVVWQPRPSADFVANMPVPFRDPLPANASVKLKKAVEPNLVREVSYTDVQPWLTMPRDWRAGFIPRFRARLEDQAFFTAMDAHLHQHPEWTVILHPPPPPETDAGNLRLSAQKKPQ